MTAETSRVRKIGKSYYVKISNQFAELDLDVGEEVQVMVSKIHYTDVPPQKNSTSKEVDYSTIAYAITTSIKKDEPMTDKQIMEKIRSNRMVPEGKENDVLNYLQQSKQICLVNDKYWRT